ncbi:MAG: DUF3971 domain-containing protein [Pseudomonadota bacterium]
MTRLRTVLLLCLLGLALASTGLYFALSRAGGVGLPGGKALLEQTLADYVEPGSLKVGQPRIAYEKGGSGVVLMLRSIRFDLLGGSTSLELGRIEAEVYGNLLSQGSIRFRTIRIRDALISHRLAEDAGMSEPLVPNALFEKLEALYDQAFGDMKLQFLAGLDVERLTVRVLDGPEPAFSGEGDLAIRQAGEALQLTAGVNWRGGDALRGALDSTVFAIIAPDRPLDAALKIEAQSLAVQDVGGASGLTVEASLIAGAQSNSRITADVSAEALTMAAGDIYREVTSFKALDMTLEYTALKDVLSITLRPLTLDNTLFAASGDILDVSTDVAQVKLAGQFGSMPVETLKRYWPSGVGEGGRVWVEENITAGRLIEPKLAVDGPLKDLVEDTAERNSLTIAFGLEDVTAHYRRPMFPLQGASADVLMTLDDMRFDISKGSINSVNAAGSTIVLTSFRQRPQLAEIDLRLAGDAGRVAKALDGEPLEYFTVYGIAPENLRGQTISRTLLRLPLLKDLLMDEVMLTSRVDANRLVWAKAMEGEPAILSGVVFEVTQNDLLLRGDYVLAGLEGAVRWKEDFTGKSEKPTQFEITGHMAPESLPRWIPGIADSVFGTIFYDAQLTGKSGTIEDVVLTADLTAALLSLPELGYEKPVGANAELYASGSRKQGRLLLNSSTLTGPDLFIMARGTLDEQNQTATLELPRVEIGLTKGELNLSRETNSWLLAGVLETFDSRPILDMLWAGDLTPPADEEPVEATDQLSISVDVQSILLENDKQADKTRFLGAFVGDHVRQLNVFGQGPSDAPFTLTIEPIDGGRRLVLAAEQAGGLASGLGILSNAEGGQLSIQATSFERGETLGLAGLLEMTNVRITDTPILARLLGLGSLTGMSDLARDRGINFKTVEVPFELNNGIVRVSNAAAYGPAMGLTADGEFLESLEQADIRGVIVPSYTINSALGRLPIVGNILVGGENEGLFGINYKVTGPLDNPELSVNAASVLTPGFLRGVFGRQKGRLEETSASQAAPGPSDGASTSLNP